MGFPRDQIIRASELAEYAYCARAWWLRRVEGLEPAGQQRREAGTLLHERHSQNLRLSVLLAWLGLIWIAGALLWLWLA